MGPTTVVGAIELASKIKAATTAIGESEFTKTLQGRSLIDVASVARVEPIVMVDADCLNVEALSDLMQSLHSMFSGYYLQAVNMVNVVNGVTVAERLAPFNPNAGHGAFEELRQDVRSSLSMEEFKHKLPMRGDAKRPVKLSMEEAKSDRESFATIRDASNLSVGKLFNVCLGDGVCMPVSIQLMVSAIPSREMVNLFSNTDVFDQDFKERYHSWKAGRLAFWKDLVLCNDLIDQRIRSSIHDPSGILAQIRARQTGNNAATAIGGKASVANATNMAILSSETAGAVENAMGGPMTNSKIRNAVFDSTNLMIIAVVNKHWERVTFWYRGQSTSSSLSFKDLKGASKDSGSNVVDIMKAYISGANPSL